jgi:diguanylate cyclase (GGDEF)-like protein
VHPDDIEPLKVEMTAHLDGLTPHFQNEHRMLHKDGTYRWMLSRGLAVRDDDGVAYRMAGSQTDITSQKTAEQQLQHDAQHDTLTGLPNRALFMERLRRSMWRARRGGFYLFAVLFLDLDRFKIVNDSLGHVVGDQLLVAIARRLESSLRPGDMVARLGGDEFVILLDHLKEIHDVTHIANRVQKELRLPFNLGGHEVFTTASMGIALSATTYERPEDLLRDADTAMYRAKARGKARFELFDASMHARAMTLLQMENDLRRALTRQEFLVYYQPIVSLATSRILGFEALVRWRHPERGMVSPAEFIPVAEETGLIIELGHWVLSEACLQMRWWQEQFPAYLPLSLSVNLSSKQFSQPNLIEQIEQILDETGLDAHSLKLEITESVLMDNIEATTAMLVQLRFMGIQVSIDDFGTGYSSLSYLHRFPINTLKVDRSFVRRMGPEGENSEIVQAIISLARNLGLDVVAEGVETEEQLSQLRLMQCDYVQGYYFSKPAAKEEVSALILGQAHWQR